MQIVLNLRHTEASGRTISSFKPAVVDTELKLRRVVEPEVILVVTCQYGLTWIHWCHCGTANLYPQHLNQRNTSSRDRGRSMLQV